MKSTKWMPVLAAVAAVLFFANPAFAQDGAATSPDGLIALGAGLAIGIAALGGGLGQGNAARAAYESIARNPQAAAKINTPFFVGMALIESLVIYALVIAFLLQGKIG
jgi:F-type H+-transporting ATPase subunit c